MLDVDGYDRRFKIEDWPLWLKMLSRGYKLYSYPNVVTLYRKHGVNMSSNTIFMYEQRCEVLEDYRDLLEYNKYIEANNYKSFIAISGNDPVYVIKRMLTCKVSSIFDRLRLIFIVLLKSAVCYVRRF